MFFPPEKTKRIPAREREYVGNGAAALLGVVTPFCSCLAVSLFIGFVESGVPLGVTFSFLVSWPVVNEVALVLRSARDWLEFEIVRINEVESRAECVPSTMVVDGTQLEAFSRYDDERGYGHRMMELCRKEAKSLP